MFIGLLVFAVVAVGLHPREVDPNNNAASFAQYAKSADWAAVHLGQFVGMSLLLAGLIVLFFALDLTNGAVRWIGLFGAISAGLALVLYAVQMAVDGVALKQAVDAWASAPAGDQATRFAAAEAVRWLEWGTGSSQSLMGGLTLVLFGIVIAWTGRAPRPVGYLMALSGLSSLAKAWILGTAGYAPSGALPGMVGQITLLATVVWFLVAAWLQKAPSLQTAPA